jgi:hypothetical protein
MKFQWNNTCDQELLLLLLLMMMMKTYSNILDRFFMCLQFFFWLQNGHFFMYNYPIRGGGVNGSGLPRRLNAEK